MAELTREQIKQAMRHPYSEWTPQFVEQLCDMAMRACDAPEGAKDAERLPNMELADGFGDPETLLNSRDWLTKAVKAKGAEFRELTFNWRYLVDAIKPIPSEHFIFGINGDAKPAILRGSDNASYLYVVMPIKQ